MFKFSDSYDFLQQFRQGDRSALEQVYFAYVEEVERFVRRFLVVAIRSGTPRPHVDAGDLVQDVFIRAFGDKARAAFDGARDYGPFLGALTRNLLLDWARRRGREVPSDDLDRHPEPSSRGRSDFADRETMAVVDQYLAELPAELRAVHECRYAQCYTQHQACSALGISRQTLRTREEQLRDGLRRRLKRLKLQQGSHTLASSTLSGRQ